MQKHSGRSILLLTLLLLQVTACFHKKEIERYQALASIDTLETRLIATLAFIRDYPESDSVLPAIISAWDMLSSTEDNDRQLAFILDQRLTHDHPGIQQYLDSVLVYRLAPDSASAQIFSSKNLKYRAEYNDRLAVALTVFPYLSCCFRADSVRMLEIQRFSDIILASDFNQVKVLKNMSDQILSLDDSLMIPISNHFLVTAIRSNTAGEIMADSVRDMNDYSLYSDLAWNAYRQGRFTYALNLISQASKYGSLDSENGYIILGASQARCDELKDGWANMLKGLVLNPEAEKQSPTIEKTFTDMFHRIRGSREDPARFLRQYRRSNR